MRKTNLAQLLARRPDGAAVGAPFISRGFETVSVEIGKGYARQTGQHGPENQARHRDSHPKPMRQGCGAWLAMQW